MAANFSQLAQIASSQEFQQRVAFAINSAAAAVYSEVTTTPSHSARAAYAIKVANGNYNLAAAALAVLTNATIAAEATIGVSLNTIPDSDIQFSINSLWNMLAGV